MRKMLAIIAGVLLISMAAAAQEAPKAEIFGGYSLFNQDVKGLTDRQNFHGWNADIAGNIGRHFALVGDFSGHYKSEGLLGASANANIYNFLFGPRVKATIGRVTPFGEVLFGASRIGAGANVLGTTIASTSDTNFAWAVGGGLDFGLSRNFAIRPAKVDYIMVRQAGESFNNVRFSTGVVLRF